MSEEKAHAEFSASGSSRWLNCPGSIALSKKAPPQRESEYAKEGTEAHKCLEFILKNRNSALRHTAKKHWPTAMVDYAEGAAAWIEWRLAQTPGAILLCETKIDASPFTCPDQFGTLDAAIVDEFGTLTVIDYKYGAGVAVEPTENSQLIYYALGVSHLYDHNFSNVELVIIQPRAYHESGNTIRLFSMDMGSLLSFEHQFIDGVKECQSPQAPLKSGSWCRFCPAAVICPQLKDKALKQAQIVFDDATGISSVPEPIMIQLPNLGTILDACDKLEEWIGKVREHAVHMLERGREIDGFKLVQKRSIRRWIDEEKTASEAGALFYGKAFTDPQLLSPAQLEKACGAKAWVDARTTAESSGTTLVRDSDKRPAVKPLQAVFDEVVVKTLPEALNGKVPKVRPKNSSVTKPERTRNDGSRRK